MGVSESKSAKTLHTTVQAMKDVVNMFKEQMEWMAGSKEIEEASKNLIKLNSMLDDEERNALRSVIKCAQTINTADFRAEIVVRSLNALIKVVLTVINKDMDFDRKVKPAITVYMQKLEKTILPDIAHALEAMNDAVNSLIEVQKSLDLLQDWCRRQQELLKSEEANREGNVRGTAYLGAGGATLGVAAIVAAANWWNPIGWGVGAAIIVGGGATAFATAAGVVEGGQIPTLQRMYDSSINELKNSSENFKATVDQAKDFQDKLKDKKTKLMTIQAEAQTSEMYAELIVIDQLPEMVDEFKASLEELEGMCKIYLEHEGPKAKMMKETTEGFKGRKSIKGYHGMFIGATSNGDANCKEKEAGAEQAIEIVEIKPNVVGFKSIYGKYLYAKDDDTLKWNSDKVQGWELFNVIKIKNNMFAFRSHRGKHLSAQPGGTLDANRIVEQAWEHFTVTAMEKE